MKKHIFAILFCCVLLLYGCNTQPEKYKRISFESEDQFNYLNDDTVVVNNAGEPFSSQIPIYEIEERIISDNERQLLMDNLEFPADPYYFEHEGNSIIISLASYTDSDRGYFNMTEEEAEEQAWKLFNQIPFMEGDYECLGIRHTYTLSDKEGTHTTRAGVVFCRVLDGVRVTGNGACTLYLDGSGLVEICLELYNYEEIGTMDMVPLADAETRIKTPDGFDIGTVESQPYKQVETLQVNQVNLRLVNQYSRGCNILQPIYFFTGTATVEDGTQSEFSSKVIAIPEALTYEE